MSRYFLEDGRNIPVTVIEAGPCAVTQVKSRDADGVSSIQLGFGDIKPRNSTMPQIGHDAKAGQPPRRFHGEVRFEDDGGAGEHELGQILDVSVFEGVQYVDVTGTSKGKGFQGGMKRHGFKGQLASHGVERKHRSAGSIGGHATNLGTGPKLKKGKRMAGHMGDVRVTTRSLDVVAVDTKRNLLLVKGPVPGPNRGLLSIVEAKRLNRQKTRRKAEGSK
jgi:large subunit ribosomal protein L3